MERGQSLKYHYLLKNTDLFFEKAIQSIERYGLISETDIFSIFGFFSASKSFSEQNLPDVWDWLSGDLSLPYSLTFEEGAVTLGIAQNLIATVEEAIMQKCMLAMCMGFKTSIFNKAKLDILLEKMVEHKRSFSQHDTTGDISKYILVLRAFDDLVADSLSSEEQARAYLERIRSEIEKRYRVVLDIEQIQKSTKTETLLALAKMVGSEVVNDYIFVGKTPGQRGEGDEKTCMRTKEFFEIKLGQLTQYARLAGKQKQEQEQEQETIRPRLLAIQDRLRAGMERENVHIASIPKDSPDCDYKHEILNLDIIRLFKVAGEEIELIASEYRRPIRERTSARAEPTKMTDEESKDALTQMLKAMGMANDSSSSSKLKKRSAKKEEAAADDDETNRIVKLELRRSKGQVGMRIDPCAKGLATFVAPASKGYATPPPAPISRNAQKRVAQVTKALDANNAAVAAIGKPVVSRLRKPPNRENIDFYNNLYAKTRDLPNAISIISTFFHEKKQLTYKDLQDALIKNHNFRFLRHGAVDYFCWRVDGKLLYDKVDTAHGPQAEKDKSAGWFRRIYEKVNKSGIILEKSLQ